MIFLNKINTQKNFLPRSPFPTHHYFGHCSSSLNKWSASKTAGSHVWRLKPTPLMDSLFVLGGYCFRCGSLCELPPSLFMERFMTFIKVKEVSVLFCLSKSSKPSVTAWGRFSIEGTAKLDYKLWIASSIRGQEYWNLANLRVGVSKINRNHLRSQLAVYLYLQQKRVALRYLAVPKWSLFLMKGVFTWSRE